MEELNKSYKTHKQEILARLEEFSQLDRKEHRKELFFCILTPQSNAEKCWQAVKELENCTLETNNVQNCIKTKTRFYRNKTRYLLEAIEKWPQVQEQIEKEKDPKKIREFLVNNIKGMGLKEASHFLRNIGKSKNQLAILDRHILRKMKELSLVEEDNIRNKEDYLNKEKTLSNYSKQQNIPLDHLDLLFWKIESGRIFK